VAISPRQVPREEALTRTVCHHGLNVNDAIADLGSVRAGIHKNCAAYSGWYACRKLQPRKPLA
jgi:hypothetical protein